MKYTFITNQAEVAEASTNTYEPFKNLFITKIPSTGEEVGYELRGDMVVVKYEQTEDERLLIESSSIYDQLDGDVTTLIPRIFGVVAHMHHVTKLKLGGKVILIEVMVNRPDGVYYTERTGSGVVIRHALDGLVFMRVGETYIAVNNATLITLHRQYICLSVGMFIPGEYLVRFVQGEKFIYAPMAHAFHDAVVAHSFNQAIVPEQWVECSHELTFEIGALV